MQKIKIILLPIIFWIVLTVVTSIYYIIQYPMKDTLISFPFIFLFLNSLIAMCSSFYACYFYFKKKENLLISIIIILTPAFLCYLIAYSIKGNWSESFYLTPSSTSYLILGLLLYLSYDRFAKLKTQKELEKQNIQSELALLKNQINPHFLFNTLNNIDSLIKSDPQKASDTLVELSDMMRYMIYETNAEKVSLKQELDYIENYLELQTLQYANPKLVKYEVKGNPDNVIVPPMLFISFIENAFKHCTDKDEEYAIQFTFDISSRVILFEAMNIYDENQKIAKDKSSGVGLDIVKRRLEILYPNKHELVIQQKNNLFCISLKLELND